MQKTSFHRGETQWFSDQHLRLVYDQKSFDSFLTEPFSKEAILKQIDRKAAQFGTEARTTMANALMNQYKNTPISKETQTNIESIKETNTFTITTGHQLSLYTGTFYFVIKILHVIKMCEELKATYSDYNFVPVYWMASEDHDFEEIQSLHIFNKKITWEKEAEGPVGLMDTEGLEAIREEMHELFKNHPESEIQEVLDTLQGQNYAQAARNLVNRMFGDRGLVILDGDDCDLKKSFAPLFEKELTEQFSFSQVESTTKRVVEAGGKDQVMPREINLFYCEKGIRSRIEKKGDRFTAEGAGEFTLDDLMAAPEKISPNVILRPLYQEFILPNLTYVGGGGEISYWLQLKTVFEAAGVVYPLIQVRNSVVWMDRSTVSKLEKIEGSIADLFKDEDAWKKEFVLESDEDELDMTAVDMSFQGLSEELKGLILGIDASKSTFIEAELARMEKQLESIKAKAVKFSKSNHDQAMKAIEFIKSRINPSGGLQERSVNFFQFCNEGHVSARISELYEGLEPFNGDLIVLMETT